MYAVQKLRHYLLTNTVYLISKINPLKILVTKAGSLNARLAKWAILLSQFDIVYISQKAVKGQALADFLAAHAFSSGDSLNDDLPDDQVMYINQEQKEWQLYFNGASRKTSNGTILVGAGLVFISPDNQMIPYSFIIRDVCTNNEAEYQALIIGLEIAQEVGIKHIQIYGDSKLIVNQMKGIYEVKKSELLSYHLKATSLLERFSCVEIEHIPRG